MIFLGIFFSCCCWCNNNVSTITIRCYKDHPELSIHNKSASMHPCMWGLYCYWMDGAAIHSISTEEEKKKQRSVFIRLLWALLVCSARLLMQIIILKVVTIFHCSRAVSCIFSLRFAFATHIVSFWILQSLKMCSKRERERAEDRKREREKGFVKLCCQSKPLKCSIKWYFKMFAHRSLLFTTTQKKLWNCVVWYALVKMHILLCALFRWSHRYLSQLTIDDTHMLVSFSKTHITHRDMIIRM